jgi:hypothetical protein
MQCDWTVGFHYLTLVEDTLGPWLIMMQEGSALHIYRQVLTKGKATRAPAIKLLFDSPC